MKLLQLFPYCSLDFFTKTFEYLFNNVLGQDGIICDDVGCWSGINKGDDSIYDVDIGLCDISEVMEANNQVAPAHESPIGSPIVVVDGEGIQ